MNSQFQMKNHYNANTSNTNHFPYINQKYANENKGYSKDSPPQVSKIYKKSGSKVTFSFKKNEIL